MEQIDILIEIYTKMLSIYNRRLKAIVKSSSNDLTYVQINYLEIIASKKQIMLSELARIMNVSKAAITSIINILLEKGYIIKTPSKSDGRVSYISITDKYKHYRYPGMQLTREFMEKMSEALSEEELGQLKKILYTINKLY